MPLRIMLYGFYGVGELCDDFMAAATKQTFEELSERPIQWVAPSEPADLIILGGGSLLGTNLYLEQLGQIVRRQACPFCIFGTGVRDVEKGDFLPGLRYLWDRAASISVRGETSRERLKDWGIDTGKIETLGDPIFLSKPVGLGKQGYIGYIGGVIRPTPTSYPEWMKNALEFLRTTRNQPVKLFSFCEAQLDVRGNERSGYENYSLDAPQTRSAIARASFWFGNRLHAFCLALVEGVPAIGVEIEFRKVEDVCTTLAYPYYTNAGQIGIEWLYNQLVRNWEELKPFWQEKIATIHRNLRSQAQHILGMVR